MAMGNFTYYPTKLATTPLYQVRLIIGDVVATDPQMQDEEINWFLTMRSSVWGAAAECCATLAAKFGRSVDQAVGTAKISFSQMAKAYTGKAAFFNAKAAMMGSGLPYAGGLSAADMINALNNDDRVAPSFTIGMTDNFLPVAPAGGETEEQSSFSGGIS
jgi:hypothetical protein